MTVIDWNRLWAAIQEVGAELRPILETKGTSPPEWASQLADALDVASEHVADILASD